jgi:hypothetical protein
MPNFQAVMPHGSEIKHHAQRSPHATGKYVKFHPQAPVVFTVE